MLWLDGGYLKVWKVDKKEKYTALQCSSGSKQKDGTYKNSNWNVRVIDTNIEISEGDTIKPIKAAIENIWDREAKKNWLNVIVFSCEVQGATPKQNEQYEVAEDDDELPF